MAVIPANSNDNISTSLW